MAGKQVLRIETRERLRIGNVRHVAGLVRDPTARPVPEPVIALGGADYAAARKALRNAPRRPGRRPHEAVELVLAGPPPFDGTGGAPWAPEREREWAHAAYAWARSILGPESMVAAAGWHRDEAAPHIHVLAVPRPEGGGGRIGWCAVRDAAVSKICGGRRAGSRYRVLQDDLHARVSHRFGLGRGEVGSEALHEAIDRVKAVEARTRQAQREATQAAEGMLAAHAEHEALLVRIGRAMEKEAELDRRTAQARERAEAAEAEAARAVERTRQARAGTHAEGGGGVLPRSAGAAGRGRGVAEADGVGALPHLGGEGAGGRGGRRGRGARGGPGTAGARRGGWPADGRGSGRLHAPGGPGVRGRDAQGNAFTSRPHVAPAGGGDLHLASATLEEVEAARAIARRRWRAGTRPSRCSPCGVQAAGAESRGGVGR